MRMHAALLAAALVAAACSFSPEDSGRIGKSTTDPALSAPPAHLMSAPRR